MNASPFSFAKLRFLLCVLAVFVSNKTAIAGADWVTYTNWTSWTNALYSKDSSNQFCAFMGAPFKIKEHPELTARFLEIATTNSGTNDMSKVVSDLAIVWLGDMGNAATNALPFLERLVLDSNRPDGPRRLGLSAIFQISPRSPIAEGLLSKILNNDSTNVLYEYALNSVADAAIAHKKTGYPQATNYVVPLLESLATGTNVHQRLIIRTLGALALHDPHIVPTLKNQLNSTNPSNRAEAIGALYTAGDNTAKELTRNDIIKLGGFLFDMDGEVRSHAASVLAGIGTNALPALANIQRATKSEDKTVADAANQMLWHLNNKSK